MKQKTTCATLLTITLFLTLLTNTINSQDLNIQEATIQDIQHAFSQNKLTSRRLTDFYLDQIKHLNPTLRSVVEVNPDARAQADKADYERTRNDGCRSELHGIPVLLKDTFATKDKLNTTAGSYALLGSVVPRDAGVVDMLRRAGAVVLGKASLSEWYNFRALGKIPNGWCARSGQGMNPYVPSGNPCGSSSGSAISVAANMVTVSLGSETHGSILCPSDYNSVVGFKPTVGLTSRAGIIPVAPRQDTIGPIARTVSDAVYLLDAIVGFDPRDHDATKDAAKHIPSDGYKQFLNAEGLKGKRLGLVKKLYAHFLNKSNNGPAFEQHLQILRQKGAIIMDNLEIANINTILSSKKSGEATVMLAEFKMSLNEYLKDLVTSPVRSLADVIAFNKNNPDLEKTDEYGQYTFIESEKTNGIGDKERRALELMKNLSRDGFEKLMMDNKLDAIVTPGTGAIPVLAIGGYPGITVPAGYDDNNMPFGICFGGLRFTEPKLVEIAYAFEQATMSRKPPPPLLKPFLWGDEL